MGRLSKATLLDIELSAICTRNQYTHDPGPVIDELRRVAGKRTDLLAMVAGMWAGYYRNPYTTELADALLQIPGATEWVPLGVKRRGAEPHRTP
jgi:hypothetical protein